MSNANTNLKVKVYPIDLPSGATKAFASVTIGDVVAIRDLRVVEGKSGLFVSMPRAENKNGKHYDVAFPTTGGLRKDISAAILDAYDEAVKGGAKRTNEERAVNAERSETAEPPKQPYYEVRVYPIAEPLGTTKAFASVSFEDLIAIRDLRVVEGKNGLFVSMPTVKGSDGVYRDVAFPTTGDLRRELTQTVLAEYENAINRDDRENAKDAKEKDEKAASEKPGIADRLEEAKGKAAARESQKSDAKKDARRENAAPGK
jgi:DNA-binding cell septation regulator SpoVG